MCLEEKSLREIWGSLFQSDVCAKVRDLNNEIVGPLMLIEQTLLAFKELGKNYVNCLKDFKLVKHELDNSRIEIKALKEKLNETVKPCENCETLFKELTVAKTRAKDAESRVSQIASILVIPKVDNSSKDNVSPIKSPKRKRNCTRDKNENTDNSNSSQTVEIGCDESQTSDIATGRSDNSQNVSPKSSKSDKLTPVLIRRRLSRSANLDSSFEKRTSPRRNLSAEFDLERTVKSPRKNKRPISESSKSTDKRYGEDQPLEDITDGFHKDNNLFTKYTKKSRDELDVHRRREDKESVFAKNKEKEEIKHNHINRENELKGNSTINDRLDCADSNGPRGNNEAWKTKPARSQRSLKSEKLVLNSDNSYDIVFEKKRPKKMFKQLTLQMKPSKKNIEENVGVESDTEDLILPSPDKFSTQANTNVDEEADDLDGPFAPSTTSTQKPVDIPVNSVPDKWKSPSTPKQKGAADLGSKKVMDNSFDVIVDRKKTLSPNYKYKGKTVRGKARAKLQGWDCEECKKFYELACKNLSPSKAKLKMNYCSKHRSKYKQTRPPTPPGFWDIDIPESPE